MPILSTSKFTGTRWAIREIGRRLDIFEPTSGFETRCQDLVEIGQSAEIFCGCRAFDKHRERTLIIDEMHEVLLIE